MLGISGEGKKAKKPKTQSSETKSETQIKTKNIFNHVNVLPHFSFIQNQF